MNATLACNTYNAHSVADGGEEGDVTTGRAEWNVRRLCWDASIAERTFSQLCDICPVVSSRLPTELWDHIIDFIADDDIYDMRRLGQVCHGWHAQCRFRSYERLRMRRMDKKEMYHLMSTLCKHPEQCGAVETVLFDFELRSIGLLGSFAVRMVQKLPRVESLKLWHCTWETGQLHAQVLLHVTLTFGSVTKLELFNVTFPSAVVFGRLLRALPRLASLKCWYVQFKKGCHVEGVVRVPLGSLQLDVVDLYDSDDVFDLLASIGVHLRHLICHGHHLRKHSKLLALSAKSLLSLEVRDIHEVPSIDLTPALNLRVLSFNNDLEDIAKAASLLSRTSLPKLAEVIIKSRPATRGRLVSVQDTLNSIDDCGFPRMDRILSGRQFPALRKVTLLLRCFAEDSSEAMDVISEASWRTLLSSRLPALHASGRLL
ncbi:uncharacterized protein FIBRA_07726 [Fibroporia radiculosa]|uniref:F-box domain-containing protein n=1 Tax=Fibroporia radiculosa TaxID=599839 RepID=J4GFE0_9APHY|nr:uncharacterized protein FIBRA_07726 [Fibroporia radiculosa]CCM05503.1 predicted protein [Fibroporia radiculosa]